MQPSVAKVPQTGACCLSHGRSTEVEGTSRYIAGAMKGSAVVEYEMHGGYMEFDKRPHRLWRHEPFVTVCPLELYHGGSGLGNTCLGFEVRDVVKYFLLVHEAETELTEII